VLAVGFLLWLRRPRDITQNAKRKTRLVVLASLLLFVVFTYVFYNRTFVQHQGRYLFPALIPIALGAALATDALLRAVRWPQRLRPMAFAAPYLAMIALAIIALWRFVVPALT
jgi:hypothetical protein